jgi:hypothetical protein
MGGGDHGRAAEGMADQQFHLAIRGVHELHRADGVLHLVRERTVAPVTLGTTEAEIVEAQHPDALACELLADPTGGGTVLAEREAVGEDGPSAQVTFGKIDEARQCRPRGARKSDALGHARHPVTLIAETEHRSHFATGSQSLRSLAA